MALDVHSFIKRIDGRIAISTYLGRKIERYAEAFLDGIGEQNLITMIEQDICLTDQIPQERKVNLKMRAFNYLRFINELTPDVAYTWLPPKYQRLFEAVQGGKDWAIRQLEIIKKYLCS